MDKQEGKERVVKRYVTITDVEVWELIDEIMKIPEYSKSFNKVHNEAFKYGIVTLYEKLFITTAGKQDEDITVAEMVEKTKEGKALEDYMMEVSLMLKEILINIIVTKSAGNQTHEMLRRLFNDEVVGNENINLGYYSDSPKFMESYENRALKNLHEKR